MGNNKFSLECAEFRMLANIWIEVSSIQSWQMLVETVSGNVRSYEENVFAGPMKGSC